MEFNAFSPNLLASGGLDSDLCIWDLAKPSAPSMYPALRVSEIGRERERVRVFGVWDLAKPSAPSMYPALRVSEIGRERKREGVCLGFMLGSRL